MQSFMDRKMYDLSLAKGRTVQKIYLTLLAIAKRIAALTKHRQYDIIYMQRELFPLGGVVVERYLKKKGAVLCFDYDDALFIKKPSRYNSIATFFRSPTKTLDIFKVVDCVVAGNKWLQESAQKHGARRAETIEVAEDVSRYILPEDRASRATVTIGWLGSPSTSKYLFEIEGALRRVASEFSDVRFLMVGGGELIMPGVPWVLRDWSLTGEVDALAEIDIGLMPLPSEDWALGKSGGKARTYMAAGVVPICSAIGYNNELVVQGETGCLCSSEEEWYSTIAELVQSPGRREKMSASARNYVIENFSVEDKASQMNRLFSDLVRRDEEGVTKAKAAD
ncbi:hypothetical protein A3709_10455 [Halioglobus sp. HI00S01]|nr:hypothetical protein A3709_10455 [Halioglobus sp. HI00S01]